MIPHSFTFIRDLEKGNLQGFAMCKLPQRGFFAAIGDFFALKAGKHRISYLFIQSDQLFVTDYRGNEMIQQKAFPLQTISSFNISKSSLDGIGVASISFVQSLESKKNKVVESTYQFDLFPAFLGENTSKIESVTAINWAKDQFTDLVQKIESLA